MVTDNMTRNLKNQPTPTTAQQLGALVKSARDLMRKDKGLNGDLDRLPTLTWIMFLKFLDDMEQAREDEASLAGKPYRPAIEPPYRWRDWAANPQGMSGSDLLAFVNQDEAMRPDGARGPGLFAYLRGLQSENGHDRRDVIANAFRGLTNRMESGYLLREVVNKVNGIHFTSSAEIHTLGNLYESMLREMRDAAGDSGEFYTPRAVIRFIVEATDPQLGDIVLDPAAGTGGFLVEAYTHLAAQPPAQTVEGFQFLQERAIIGQEAKSLPYMLCQMNLLLHGLEYPRIELGNSLAVKITEISDRDRVDVILTNPPFGGEEEAGVKAGFPADKQTAETALLFLQLIMRKLRRPGLPAPVVGQEAGGEGRPGRARGRRPQRHALRRRRLRPDQGRVAQELQPAHDRPVAQRCLCALHQHSHQSALLRPLRADAGDLVLRVTAAGGAQGVHQDPTDAVRGIRRLPGLVQDLAAGGERSRVAGGLPGEAGRRRGAGDATLAGRRSGERGGVSISKPRRSRLKRN